MNATAPGALGWSEPMPHRACLLLALLAACTCPETMPESVHTHHAIDYIEISVTDLAESKRFYAAAFGWEFYDYGPDYAGIRRGDGESGGLRPVDEVARGGPLVILYSTDLEASVASVKAAGGQIVVEPFSFPGGRRFHFLDPSGNELAVWAEPDSVESSENQG